MTSDLAATKTNIQLFTKRLNNNTLRPKLENILEYFVQLYNTITQSRRYYIINIARKGHVDMRTKDLNLRNKYSTFGSTNCNIADILRHLNTFKTIQMLHKVSKKVIRQELSLKKIHKSIYLMFLPILQW